MKRERGRRERFFFFFFFGGGGGGGGGGVAVNTRARGSNHTVSILIQTVTYRISTDQIAIKDGCCCGGR